VTDLSEFEEERPKERQVGDKLEQFLELLPEADQEKFAEAVANPRYSPRVLHDVLSKWAKRDGLDGVPGHSSISRSVRDARRG